MEVWYKHEVMSVPSVEFDAVQYNINAITVCEYVDNNNFIMVNIF